MDSNPSFSALAWKMPYITILIIVVTMSSQFLRLPCLAPHFHLCHTKRNNSPWNSWSNCLTWLARVWDLNKGYGKKKKNIEYMCGAQAHRGRKKCSFVTVRPCSVASNLRRPRKILTFYVICTLCGLFCHLMMCLEPLDATGGNGNYGNAHRNQYGGSQKKKKNTTGGSCTTPGYLPEAYQLNSLPFHRRSFFRISCHFS